jgi:hypothetical protein
VRIYFVVSLFFGGSLWCFRSAADQELNTDKKQDDEQEESEPSWIKSRRDFLQEHKTVDMFDEDGALKPEYSEPNEIGASGKPTTASKKNASKDQNKSTGGKGKHNNNNNSKVKGEEAKQSNKATEASSTKPSKKVSGKGPRAAGGYTTNQAKKKTENKSAVANHNRKKQAAKKFSKGL